MFIIPKSEKYKYILMILSKKKSFYLITYRALINTTYFENWNLINYLYFCSVGSCYW